MKKEFITIVFAIFASNIFAADGIQSAPVAEVAIKASFTMQGLQKAVHVASSILKNEFESTEVFNKRRCEVLRQQLGGDAETVFHFPMSASLGKTQPHYDADRQEFMYEVEGFSRSTFANLSAIGLGLVVNRGTAEGKPYVGQNAFGVAKTIRVTKLTTLGLLISTYGTANASKFALRADPELARQLKGDLQLLVSARLESPCLDGGSSYRAPMIDSPQEVTDKLTALIAKGDATWEITKASSGEVLASGHVAF